jgi:hypothetical protein
MQSSPSSSDVHLWGNVRLEFPLTSASSRTTPLNLRVAAVEGFCVRDRFQDAVVVHFEDGRRMSVAVVDGVLHGNAVLYGIRRWA